MASQSETPRPSFKVCEEKATDHRVDGNVEHDAILNAQIILPESRASYKDLYRYISTVEWLALAASIICALIAGGIIPCFPLLFGDMAALFRAFVLGEVSNSYFNDQLAQKSLYLVYLGLGEFVATYISMVGFMWFGEVTTRKLRQQYFRALLKQDIAFFDGNSPGQLSSRLSHDCHTVQEGISEKSAYIMTAVGTVIAAYIVSFIRSWELTLVASAILIVCLGTSAISTRYIIQFTRPAMAALNIAGGLADEVIRSIRTVKVLCAEQTFSKQYQDELTRSGASATCARYIAASMVAILMTTTFWSHALTFWSGSIFVSQGNASIQDVITVAFAVLLAAHSVGMVAPHVRTMSGATVAASHLFQIIDRRVFMDATTNQGTCLEDVKGHLCLRGVSHVYPSRPEKVVLEAIDVDFPAHKTTAIVGHTGSGKSSIINLLQRMYPALNGTILLDGHDILQLNPKWYRQQIGVVSQEPILTGHTIYESICHGALEDELPMERIIVVAKEANAHNFITNLPDGYSTKIGESGSQLSIGQKQRIAIARALVRQPAVLIFDEATSALDSESERLIQEAMQRVSNDRTLIMIAHRLSTVMRADNIVVLSNGRIVEQGSHYDLMGNKSEYASLVEAQKNAHSQPADLSTLDDDNETLVDKQQLYAEVQQLQNGQKRSGHVSLRTMIRLIASFNHQEQLYMVFGLVFSVLAGCCNPVLAFALAKAIAALSQPTVLMSKLRADTQFWALIMFVVGIACLLCNVGHGLIFACCSERLVYRARGQAFRSILAKDVAFFDREKNQVGALTHTLSVEAKNLAGISGATLGTILATTTMLVTAVVISLAVGWKVALVCGATIPIILGCGYYRVRMIAIFAQRMHNSHQKSSAFASSATFNIRTISSLSREEATAKEYDIQLMRQEQKGMISILKTSIPFAAAKSFLFFCVALAFWYGGTRVARGEYSIFQFFLCFAEIIFAAQSAAFVFSSASDIGKAKQAARVFHDLLSDNSTIVQNDNCPPIEALRGSVALENVAFSYPSRPQRAVLDGLNLRVSPKRFIALVGTSGCGKSTVLSLLIRYYDPDSGRVLIDGDPLPSLNLQSYRQRLAFVSQEPVLYQGTLRKNLLLGIEGEQVSEEELVTACKDAHIYDFVQSLDSGFETMVGSRGIMLSGGQKQRVVIARALLRKPKMLILDEATSALDSTSENLVIDALQRASSGCTTIAVAHRLSSILHADQILVIEHGQVVEQGTHSELMANRGKYHSFASLQTVM